MTDDKLKKNDLKDLENESVKNLSKVIHPNIVSQVFKEEKDFTDIRKVLKKLKNPLLGGAEDLVSVDDLDTYHPTNDSKYLRLLFAVFGFNDLQKILAADNQKEELDSMENN